MVKKVRSSKLSPYKEILTICNEMLTSASELKQVLKYIIMILVNNVEPADAGIIYLYDSKKQLLTAEASYGYISEDIQCLIRPKEGAPGQCYALQKTLVFPSPEDVKRGIETLTPANLKFYSKMREGLLPILGMVVIPLQLWGKMFLGALQLEQYREHRPFMEEDIRNLEEICSWIALVTDNVQVHAELKQRKRSYRELFGKFLRSSEEERKKIAREIHDEVNQLLLCIKIDLESIENILPSEYVELKDKLENSRLHINQVLDELHDLSLSLRPLALDDLGLPQALDWYINNRLRETRFPVILEVSGTKHRRPAPIVETELFRIAQEALSNAIKHSQATFVKVNLLFNEAQLVLSVEDNGRGFNSEDLSDIYGNERNLGLLGMMERARLLGGDLSIDTAPGHGTRIKVGIPVSSHDWGEY